MITGNAKILIIGAGVNGSACASVLQNSGIDVTVLARGKRYDEILSEGIIIENPVKNKRSVSKVKVINTLNWDDFYDYVLVIIRKNQVPELLPVLAANCSPNIVFMGNNLAGPDEYTNALGKERVMFGFVYAGGKREGDIIKAIIIKSIAVPFGEINGAITPRLIRLINILRHGGFRAKASTRIIDFLMTHGVGVPLFANLIIKYKCDARALSKSSTDLNLLVKALRESIDILPALGYRVVPKIQYLGKIIPRFIFVSFLQLFLSSKLCEVGGVYHVTQAPDEMHCLTNELKVLVEKSGLPLTAIRKVLSINL
jgi:2-dehydropantoate 2-reductase